MTSLQKTKRISWVSIILWVLRVVVIALVIYGSAVTLASGKYAPSSWISLLIAGLAQGSIYALIALGYSLVYGIMLMINFAHGEVFMAGAFSVAYKHLRAHQTAYDLGFPVVVG